VPIQVAIDGPVASGKSTVARRLADRLGFVFLDTGALYRAVAYLALERGVAPMLMVSRRSSRRTRPK